MKWDNDGYHVTDAKDEIDIDFVIDSLHKTYWAETRPVEVIRKSLDGSIVLSLFEAKKQIGFARIVSDYATFAWICDVYVDPGYRGKGLGKFLMRCVTEHPAADVKTNILGTKDAHGLYEKFGFTRKELMIKKKE